VIVGWTTMRWQQRQIGAKNETRARGAIGKKAGEQNRKHIVSKSDEHMRAMPCKPCPRMFVGQATSPMNISHVYPSMTWPN
jgi:hypothetical protein